MYLYDIINQKPKIMKKTITLAFVALFVACSSFAQTAGEKPSMVTETTPMLPKRGMEAKFEAAVKAHNTKYHPDGPYTAGLRKVEYGDNAGWYVWVFGPTTYASLDSRPAIGGGHDADWEATVDPLVESYGAPELWEMNDDLSYGKDMLKTAKYYEVWRVNLERGDYYRFKALAEKLQKAHESQGKMAFLIFNNMLHTAKSGDVAILWSFNSYAEWAKDAGIKQAYEKIYGAGTWQNMVNEWRDITVDYTSEIRSFVR